LHLLILILILTVGAALRFWNLDVKPLWMDEVITALFSLGRSYYDVPLETVFQVSALDQVFRLNPTTCATIAQTISVQSVHPPLFFCWLHQWVQIVPGHWVWQLRSLPALAGVVAIAAIYYLNRIAFSKSAGLVAAIAMAVSPFAVYLSQEARHYTVPMVFVIMALLGLIQIQQDLQRQRIRFSVWIGWTIVNSVGFYVHYFFSLAIVAQILTLIALQVIRIRSNPPAQKASWIAIVLSSLGIGLLCLPWLPTFISHMSRPETDWLEVTKTGLLSIVAPFYQSLAGWLVMSIALPVEYQPIWRASIAGVLMLVFGGWLAWQVTNGVQKLWNDPQTHWETRTLVSFLAWMLLQFLAIVFVLGKDITQVPRYNFVYYPAVAALVGAGLWRQFRTRKNQYRFYSLIITVGTISSILVVTNFVFLKSYNPDRVAADIRNSSTNPPLVVMAYQDFQDIALSLSFALALPRKDSSFALVSRAQSYEQFWRQLSNLDRRSQQLWVIAPGLKRQDFPQKLSLSGATCTLNPAQHHRIGIPYQGYDCQS
jgi:uncharacterized membrane protein